MKKEDEKKPPVQALIHAAVSSVAPPAIIENNTVIALYEKVYQRYDLAAVKSVETALDSGNWIKSVKPWDPDKVMKDDRLMLDGKKQTQVIVLDTYLCGKVEHPAVQKLINQKKEESKLIKEGKKKGKVEPIMLSGKPLRKDERYILVQSVKTKRQIIIRPTEAIAKMEFQHCKTLAAARKEDKETADSLVQYMIARTAKAFNIKRNISPEQIKDTLENLALEYPWLKLSEIYFVLRGIKMGRYGPIYESFDEPTIMTAFDKYVNEERDKVIDERNYLKHDALTAGEKSRAYDGYVVGLIEKSQRENRSKESDMVRNKAERLAGRIVDNFFVNEKTNQLQADRGGRNFEKPTPQDNGQQASNDNQRSSAGNDDAKK